MNFKIGQKIKIKEEMYITEDFYLDKVFPDADTKLGRFYVGTEFEVVDVNLINDEIIVRTTNHFSSQLYRVKLKKIKEKIYYTDTNLFESII